MSVRIDSKEQVAQWTFFNNASSDDIQVCDVINGIEWEINVRFREEPEYGENVSNCMTTIENNGQRVHADLRMINTKKVLSGFHSPCLIFLGQINVGENKVNKYYILYCVHAVSNNSSPSWLLHIFLYKKTETLPPISQ